MGKFVGCREPRRAAGRSALLAIAVLSTAACGSMPKPPMMPDGKHRVAVNTAARIEAFQERLEEMRGYEADRVRWAQEVGELRSQVAQLRSATIILAANAEERAGTPLSLTRGAPGAGLAAIGQVHSMPVHPPVMTAARESAQPSAVLQAPDALRTPRHVSAPPPLGAQPARPTGPSGGPVRVRVIGPEAEPAQGARAPEVQENLRTPPVAPGRLDFESNQLEIGRPPPPPVRDVAPERIERVAHFESTTGRSIEFANEQLVAGFRPDPGQSSELLAATRTSARVVIRSVVTAEASDRASVTRAHERAQEARAWLVERGVDGNRIFLSTSRREPMSGDFVRMIRMKIATDGQLQTADSAQGLANAPRPADSTGRTAAGEIGLTQISIGVQ